MKEKLSAIMKKLENSRFAPFVQFIKFGLVGVSNTLIYYVIENLGYYVVFRDAAMFGGLTALLGRLGLGVTDEQVKVEIIAIIAFIISMTNSFILNNRFVFRAEEKPSKRQLLRTYLKTALCYALTGIVLSPLLKLWMGAIGIPYWAGSLLSLVVTIPLNFVMNKFWAFAGRK